MRDGPLLRRLAPEREGHRSPAKHFAPPLAGEYIRQLDVAEQRLRFRYEIANHFVATAGLTLPYDVAIALSTLGRIPPERQAAAARNLAAAFAPGGLVLEDMVDMTLHGPLEPLGGGIYRRRAT